MSLPESHRRLLADVLGPPAGAPFALAGGYALEAHGLLERPHANIDLATESGEPTRRLAWALGAALTGLGHEVGIEDTTPLTAHLTVGGVALTLHKEVFSAPPVPTAYGPALSLQDAVGTKMRALYGRGLAVDLIDARAAAARFSFPELEELARRHLRDDDFDLPALQDRLTGTDHYPDTAFTAHGLTEAGITGLRAWAQSWSTDIAERLLEDGASPD
ncbi:hypothetical protein [Streptomyces sp. NPDC002588]|uniref:hypothetical protein n=1 Tax=Streptomyces sp. NPDC002588 TaxID=3154419 RepID=UPI00332E0C06